MDTLGTAKPTLEGILSNMNDCRLYRTATTDGHVKWVCIGPYYENYQEKAAKAFRGAHWEDCFDEETLDVLDDFSQECNSRQAFTMRLEKTASQSTFWRVRVNPNVDVLELNLQYRGDPAQRHPQP